jgi:hypothetical protein
MAARNDIIEDLRRRTDDIRHPTVDGRYPLMKVEVGRCPQGGAPP